MGLWGEWGILGAESTFQEEMGRAGGLACPGAWHQGWGWGRGSTGGRALPSPSPICPLGSGVHGWWQRTPG